MAHSMKTPVNSLLVLDVPKGSTCVEKSRPSSSKKYYKREDSSTSLEFLPSEETNVKKHRKSNGHGDGGNLKYTSDGRPLSSGRSGSRPNSSTGQNSSRRPNSSGRSGALTPTKHVSLQAVRRKDSDDHSYGDIDWNELEEIDRKNFSSYRSSPTHSQSSARSLSGRLGSLDLCKDPHPSSSSASSVAVGTVSDTSLASSSTSMSATSSTSLQGAFVVGCRESGTGPMKHESSQWNTSTNNNQYLVKSLVVPENIITEDKGAASNSDVKVVDLENSDEFDTDLESGEDDSSDEGSSTSRKAPSQLLMEFVSCLMEEDYPNAKKLCQMILLYEPNNEEALKFQPLIDEKIELDEEESDSGEDSDSDEDDDSDDDDDDDNSSEDTDEEDEDENDEEEERSKDSGLGTAEQSVSSFSINS